jgi:TonB family protein
MNTSLIWDNLIAYSLQVGLLIGIAGFVPGLLGLRLPRVRLAFWHALLAACLILPAVGPWKQTMTTLVQVAPRPIPPPVAAAPVNMPAPAFSAAEIALLLLAGGAMLRLAWLLAGFWRLSRLKRHSDPLTPASSWGVEADIRVSEAISSPVTFGVWRPTVLLPANFPELDPAAQDAILCHEIFHVRRRDWLFTITEELIRSVLWFHPAIWWLLGEIGLAREQVVDGEVVALTRLRDEYLDALLAIAGAPVRLDLAPAPLFLRRRHLKQRVISLMKEVRMSKTRSVLSLATGLGVVALACWLVTATFPLAAAPQTVSDGTGVTVDTGGAVMHRTPVNYPAEARKTRAAGTVTVEATLDSSGNVQEARVLSGPAELRKAALQSVLNWHFATDNGGNTRLVKITFDAPSGADVDIQGVLAAAQERANTTGRSISGETVIPAEGNVKRTITYAVTPSPSYEGKTVIQITVQGVSQQTRSDLVSRLGVHIGDRLGADTLSTLRKTVREFDEHLDVAVLTPSNDGVIVYIKAPGSTYPAEGGVIGGTVSGITTGVPGGVLGGAIRSVPAEMPPPPPPANGVKRLHVGANVQRARLVSQPRPIYPPLAKQARVSGVVQLQALIGTDGGIINLTVISGHPLLIPSALEAVRQWRYQPTLLNGEPVEVVTQIDVNFTLSDTPPAQDPPQM